MNRNEPNLLFRKSPSFPVYDASGRLAAGQTFLTAQGEVLISIDGAAPVAAAADIVPVSRGLYRYVHSQAETIGNVDTLVWAIKKATLSIPGYATVVRAKLFGIPPNDYTMTWVSDPAVTPTTGTLVLTGADYVFTYDPTVTTLANFETLVTGDANLEVATTGGVHTLISGDAFGPKYFTGGLEASVTTPIVQTAVPTLADISTAVWALTSEGSIQYGDAIRFLTSVVAGLSRGYGTGTETFQNPAGTKDRAQYTVTDDGREALTILDLTP